jgi:hypothetical protein
MSKSRKRKRRKTYRQKAKRKRQTKYRRKTQHRRNTKYRRKTKRRKTKVRGGADSGSQEKWLGRQLGRAASSRRYPGRMLGLSHPGRMLGLSQPTAEPAQESAEESVEESAASLPPFSNDPLFKEDEDAYMKKLEEKATEKDNILFPPDSSGELSDKVLDTGLESLLSSKDHRTVVKRIYDKTWYEDDDPFADPLHGKHKPPQQLSDIFQSKMTEYEKNASLCRDESQSQPLPYGWRVGAGTFRILSLLWDAVDPYPSHIAYPLEINKVFELITPDEAHVKSVNLPLTFATTDIGQGSSPLRYNIPFMMKYMRGIVDLKNIKVYVNFNQYSTQNKFKEEIFKIACPDDDCLYLWIPIIDYNAPNVSQLIYWVHLCKYCRDHSMRMIYHCGAGRGRTIFMTLCNLLYMTKLYAEEAVIGASIVNGTRVKITGGEQEDIGKIGTVENEEGDEWSVLCDSGRVKVNSGFLEVMPKINPKEGIESLLRKSVKWRKARAFCTSAQDYIEKVLKTEKQLYNLLEIFLPKGWDYSDGELFNVVEFTAPAGDDGAYQLLIERLNRVRDLLSIPVDPSFNPYESGLEWAKEWVVRHKPRLSLIVKGEKESAGFTCDDNLIVNGVLDGSSAEEAQITTGMKLIKYPEYSQGEGVKTEPGEPGAWNSVGRGVMKCEKPWTFVFESK